MTIHTIGDSHASNTISGWRDCNDIESHHIGAILCYSFGEGKLERCDISKYGIKEGDSVIFCFGEIDCRCHIQKHITSTRTYKMIIDEIVKNYVEAIRVNIENCNIKLKRVSIFNVVPAVQKYNTYENHEYPYLGSDEERREYVLYFNKCLKEKCEENSWIFFDIWEKCIDNNGYLNKTISDGNVHIRFGGYHKEFIEKYF